MLGGGLVVVGGGGVEWGLGEEGLVGREVLMDFRLVSQFLFTQERGGGGLVGWRGGR